MYSLINKGIKM